MEQPIASHPGHGGPEVILEGEGIAAVCAARLLTDAGIRCALDAQPRPKLAAILLGEQTQHLLRQLFPPHEDTGDLFTGFARIRRRIVLWGEAAAPVDLPHSGIVAPEKELLHRLWQRVPALPKAAEQEEAVFHLRSARSPMAPARERSFGTRTGRLASVELSTDAAQDCCWVESVPAGWLFLLALGGGTASLIAVGDTVDRLLAQSRVVRPNVGCILSETPPIPVYPRLAQTLATGRWIACGTAALSFDPLCGEGAGHAIREGFLAAAFIRSALAGTSRETLTEHYTARLSQGMLRHLHTCLPFYATGGSTAFWTAEAEALRHGIEDLQGEVSLLPPPRFRLVDRDLVPL